MIGRIALLVASYVRFESTCMPTRIITGLTVAAVLILAAATVPAAALGAPTASQITEPAEPAYVTADDANPGTLHVAGTTSGGPGNVDLRCYTSAGSTAIASGVTVVGGAFAIDVPITKALVSTFGYPYPYCVLRAV